MKHFVGHKDGKLVHFKSAEQPTHASHGALYAAVIGPFKTKRAALWAEKHGKHNPHFQHVDDAERLSREAS